MGQKRTVLLSALLLAVFGTIALLGTLFVLRSPARRDATALETDIDGSIQHLQRIASLEYVYRSVIYAADERRVLAVPVGSEVLFSITIRVQAGIDFSDGYSVEVENGENVFLTLPAPSIFLVDAQEESIDEYFSQERIFRVDWLDIGSRIEHEKERVRDDALERGILDEARVNAAILVRDLVELAGYENVMIRFRPAGSEVRG